MLYNAIKKDVLVRLNTEKRRDYLNTLPLGERVNVLRLFDKNLYFEYYNDLTNNKDRAFISKGVRSKNSLPGIRMRK